MNFLNYCSEDLYYSLEFDLASKWTLVYVIVIRLKYIFYSPILRFHVKNLQKNISLGNIYVLKMNFKIFEPKWKLLNSKLYMHFCLIKYINAHKSEACQIKII